MGMWEVIVRYSGDLSGLGAELGAEVELLDGNYAIITLAAERVERLYTYPQIIYIELPKRLALNLNGALRQTCADGAHNPDVYGLRGKGVLVAILDSGIDYRHRDFRNPDGTTRILYIWDQTADAEYDAERINAVLSGAAAPDSVPVTDTVGHGTAVAGIAAGNGAESGGREVGVAPEASLLIVKLGRRGYESFARTTELMRALKYAADKAARLNMPLAVNISYGTNNGGHDGRSLFESYINDTAQRWKTVIAVASGNEGGAGHHFTAAVGAGETAEVQFVTAPNLPSMYMTMWKDFADTFNIELIAPDGTNSGVITPDKSLTAMRTGGAAGNGGTVYIFYEQPTHYNGGQEIFFSFGGEGGTGGGADVPLPDASRTRYPFAAGPVPDGVWTLRVTGVSVTVGRFHIWLPVTEEVTEKTAFLRSSPDITLTLPSTAENVLSAGGYNSDINGEAAFSGRGFTRTGAVKPDIAAPAVGILTAHSGGGYDVYTGTSMAAPFAAGAAALLMEWGIVRGNDPFLFGQRAKAFLQKGARRTAGAAYPDPVRGWGTLCVRAALDILNDQ